MCDIYAKVEETIDCVYEFWVKTGDRHLQQLVEEDSIHCIKGDKQEFTRCCGDFSKLVELAEMNESIVYRLVPPRGRSGPGPYPNWTAEENEKLRRDRDELINKRVEECKRLLAQRFSRV
jgi:hypothetical protein